MVSWWLTSYPSSDLYVYVHVYIQGDESLFTTPFGHLGNVCKSIIDFEPSLKSR